MRAGAEPWAVGRAPIGMRRLARLASSVRALPVPGAPRLGALPRRGVGADSSRRFAVPATVVDAHPAEDLPSGVRSPFAPAGDQPAAIDKCVRLLRDEGRRVACLRGATGTGKTFVVANVLDRYARDRPTLVVVPNKTLAAQVARELRGYLLHRVGSSSPTSPCTSRRASAEGDTSRSAPPSTPTSTRSGTAPPRRSSR